jgi:hypothetical protein
MRIPDRRLTRVPALTTAALHHDPHRVAANTHRLAQHLDTAVTGLLSNYFRPELPDLLCGHDLDPRSDVIGRAERTSSTLPTVASTCRSSTSIAVTTGPEKIPATRAVLRSGLVSSLVTGTEVAAAVLG